MKKRIMIIILVVVVITISSIYFSYASSDAQSIVTKDYPLLIGNTNSITLNANSSEVIYYKIKNNNNGIVNYGIAYSGSNISVKEYYISDNPSSGSINGGETKYITLYIDNSSSTSNTVTITTIFGYVNGGDLIVPTDYRLVTEKYERTTMLNYLKNLYSSASKSTVTNGGLGVTLTFNVASSENLINDRLSSSSTNADGGNIRYYGANPNNYIYFNCSDYSNQTSSTCETWRIIGVFNDKIKIMRGSQIGTLAWDQDKNVDSSLTTYDNNWTTASLMTLLNNQYYDGDTSGTITYYSGSDGSTSTTINMSNVGIKNDETREMIVDTTWNLGGWFSAMIYTFVMNGHENSTTVYSGNSSVWTGKIALAYPSDYGYAVDFTKCNKTLYNYNASACTSNNWMYNIVTNNGGTAGWLLTPISNDGVSAWNVNTQGYLRDLYKTYLAESVTPALFLHSNVIYNGGDGSSTNPYQLSL